MTSAGKNDGPRPRLRHSLHVHGQVVPIRAEGVYPGPEVRERGEAEIVLARTLAPDAPGVRMPPARLTEPALGFVRLALAEKELPEPEHGLRRRRVFRQR